MLTKVDYQNYVVKMSKVSNIPKLLDKHSTI